MPVIGVYTFCNVGSVLIHDMDQYGERVFASVNGRNPEWCEIVQTYDEDGAAHWGFFFAGSDWFIDLDLVMRTHVA